MKFFFLRKILGKGIQIFGNFLDQFVYKGCDFSKWNEMEDMGFSNEKGNKYQPSFVFFDKIIKKHYCITENDSFLDMGCGKGYAMYRAHKLGYGNIFGYDISPRLVEIANSNFEKLGYGNCQAVCCDAEYFDEYDEYNYFYMFNSFPTTVFESVLRNIESSLKRNPRKAVLILTNPINHDIVSRSELFRFDFIKKGIISWFDVSCYIAE